MNTAHRAVDLEFLNLLREARACIASDKSDSSTQAVVGLSCLAKAVLALVNALDGGRDREQTGQQLTIGQRVRSLEDAGILPELIVADLLALVQTRNIWMHSHFGTSLMSIDLSADLEKLNSLALWYLSEFQDGPSLPLNKAEALIRRSPTVVPVYRRKLFICYALEDREKASKLYSALVDRGHEPWMDKESLLPGQDWALEIRRAIRSADYFLACLSRASVSKRSFLQKEIRLAFEILEEIPPGEIYLIPIRLEPC
jgi:hypothetical protein